MTRRKKTRSLKQVHAVKTGSRSKLQKMAQNDRQHKDRYRTKDKQLSVYEQHLEAEKAAKAQAVLTNARPQTHTQLATQAQQDLDTEKAQKTPSGNPQKTDKGQKTHNKMSTTRSPSKDKSGFSSSEKTSAAEANNSLWGQLDHSALKKDLY